MAGALAEEQHARQAYATLQAASCPLVEDLDLQDADGALQLLCAPSQHRTDILTWICSSINPNFGNSKSRDPDALQKEMALLGQDLMLCMADDLDLIKGAARPHKQLRFLEELLTEVLCSKKSAGPVVDAEKLLDKLFAAENLPHLTQMLNPSHDPWPARMKAIRKDNKSTSVPNREKAADVSTLLQETQSALQQLQSECDFLNDSAQNPGDFSPSSLRVAACDLQQLMGAFSRVFETDFSIYCSKDPPSFSPEATIFQRVQQLLLACITELEMVKKVLETSVFVNNEVNQLQTQPCYWSQGEKRTLQDQLEKLHGRILGFLRTIGMHVD